MIGDIIFDDEAPAFVDVIDAVPVHIVEDVGSNFQSMDFGRRIVSCKNSMTDHVIDCVILFSKAF